MPAKVLYLFLLSLTRVRKKQRRGNRDFGDGTVSNEQDPAHNYLLAGNYTVNLTVSSGNNFASKNDTVTALGSNSDNHEGAGG
jgi:PKD repeat protein